MLDPNVFLQNPNPDFKMTQLCMVCGEPAAGYHFGSWTCEGCKSFFGRTYNNVSGIAECKNGGRCEINKKTRTSCKSCRLRKCLRVGMSKSGSRYGRRSNWFKIHCLLQAQGQQNGMGPGPNETNNNTSSATNNNPSPNYQIGKSPLPSTITSFSSGDRERDRGDHHREHRDHREMREERERTPSSSASRNGSSNGLPPGFASIPNLSPESLSSLSRKLNGSELAEYFRAAGMGGLSKGMMAAAGGLGRPLGGPLSEDERGEDMSRTTRSPGSLESPRSDTSMDDGKSSSTPQLFGMPPGSPLEVKPNDLISFDLITRDLMKMGYDPLRLWPAMFTAGPNLHQFNPYRFMFPNFPGAPGAFPPGFPPTAGNPSLPPQLLNGGLHPATKLFSASLASEGIPSPLAGIPSTLTASSLHHHASSRSHSHSPSSRASPPISQTSVRQPVTRVTPIVPPTSSLTLTPPISHHGSDEPGLFPLQKISRNAPLQEKPIDLSAKGTNNNHIDVGQYHDKILPRNTNGDISDDEDGCDNDVSDVDEKGYNSSDVEMTKINNKSDCEDSEKEEEDVVEDLSKANNNNVTKSVAIKRRLSRDSRSPCPGSSPKRASTPLDLTSTRGSNSSSSPPLAKIATAT